MEKKKQKLSSFCAQNFRKLQKSGQNFLMPRRLLIYDLKKGAILLLLGPFEINVPKLGNYSIFRNYRSLETFDMLQN